MVHKKYPNSKLFTQALPCHREAEMRERPIVIVVVVVSALRARLAALCVTPRAPRRAMRKSSHLSLVNLPTHCAMSNYFAHNSRPPRNKKLLLPTEKSIINSSWKYEWQQVGAAALARAGRHVLSTPLQRTVMQNIFFGPVKKIQCTLSIYTWGSCRFFSPP